MVRTFYLDMHAAERIAIRAQALRVAAGMLTGHALDGAREGPRVVLADVLAVFGTDAGQQWGDVASPLASPLPRPVGRRHRGCHLC
jgi:S-DNA-T family DNA segregation ATPase FtsK/SpoIIIE